MPKYYKDKIYGYYLYFTSHCTLEAMHAHASDKGLTEHGSAKFFIKSNGDTTGYDVPYKVNKTRERGFLILDTTV